ncbi:MAG TPA: transporter substrate-binding domain-containing protein [Terrimicrobiaceae bacterium]|nr:transporter substrate-binding domain-containing protein [Terrimicrobiaceae bacterium]
MVNCRGWLVLAVAWAAGWTGLHAAPLRVAAAGVEPFVMLQDGVWTGLSIDVWQKVAAINRWEYVITGYPDKQSIVDAVRAGKVDVVVANVPITSDGLRFAEFSQPYYRSGLQIMVAAARPHTLARLIQDLNTWEHVRVLWLIIAVVVVLTVVVTLFERRHNPDFPKSWHEGLAEAFYYVIALTLTGKSVYRGFPGFLGRLMLVAWTIFGVITVIYLTSSVTAAMTAEKLQASINGPADLPGRIVGAVKDSEAIGYLGHRGITTKVYPDLDEAVRGLLRGDVRAIVGSAPVLQYYDVNHPHMPITEVGPVFDPYNFGLAVPKESPLRFLINEALLKLQESGVLSDLGRKYFGPAYQP